MTTIDCFEKQIYKILNTRKNLSVENLYEIMYMNEKRKFYNLIEFIDYLNTTPLSEMEIENVDKYFDEEDLNITILNNNTVNEKLLEIIAYLSNRSETRFDKFYKFCQEHQYGQQIYTLSRLFISEYPIVHKALFKNLMEAVEYRIFMRLPMISKDDRKFIFDFLKSNYKTYPDQIVYCKRCGYIIGEDAGIHRYHLQCQGYDTENIEASPNTLIAEESAYRSIVLPTRLEIEIQNALEKCGFKVDMFPSLEIEGDIKVFINGKQLLLDAKAYESPKKLKTELDKKEHYKQRIIVVPSRVYNIMSDLKAFGYTVHSIETLQSYLEEIRDGEKEL